MGLLPLSAVMIFESVVLIALIKEAARARTIIRPHSTEAKQGKSRVVPEFSAYEAKSGRVLGAKDFLGQSNCVLFLDAHHRLTPPLVHAMIISVWEKITGNVYIVCRGTSADCETIASAVALPERVAQDVRLIQDTTSALVSTFEVDSFPSAQIYDASARLIKSGYLELSAGELDA